MESLGEILGVAGDGFGYLENVFRWKILLFLVKLASSIADLVAESFTLYHATVTKRKLSKESENFRHYNNHSGEFNTRYNFYIVFFVFNLNMNIIHLYFQIKRIQRKERATRYVSTIIMIILETPLLVIEVLMLKVQGDINWNTQFWFLVTHVAFIFNVFVSSTSDWILFVKQWTFKQFCYSIFVIASMFAMACIAYTPVSITMVGFKWGAKIKYEDFGEIIVNENVKRVLLILMELGRAGQMIITGLLVLIIVILAIVNLLKLRCQDYFSS